MRLMVYYLAPIDYPRLSTNYQQFHRLAALILLSVTLLTCTPEPIRYDWLQGEWISSVGDTVAANEIRNKPVSASAGKLIWSVQGDRLFTTDYSIDLQEDSLFEIETVSISEFRLKTANQGNFIITKTEFGFCSEAYSVASDLVTINCMIPYR
jgi:hypothetical protein